MSGLKFQHTSLGRTTTIKEQYDKLMDELTIWPHCLKDRLPKQPVVSVFASGGGATYEKVHPSLLYIIVLGSLLYADDALR